MADETTDVETTNEDPPVEPIAEPVDVPSLVGSGVPMVTVKANAGCMGLAYGEIATFAKTPELEALIANGNLSEI